jgi:uncharacterized membrane protein YgcG
VRSHARRRRRHRPAFALLGALLWLVAIGLGPVTAASVGPPSTAYDHHGAPPPGPPFPEPVDDQAVYDYADILAPDTERYAEQIADAVESQTGAEVVVFTQVGAGGSDPVDGAEALATEWGVGDAEADDGLVLFLETDTTGGPTRAAYHAGEGFMDRHMIKPALEVMVATDMGPRLATGDADTAVLTALGRVVSSTFGGDGGGEPTANDDAPPPGPPFPDPETDRAVYDFAGVLSAETIVEVEATIDAIEQRTGAEVVVYTQDAGTYALSTDETMRKARALIDQWGIGRAGFNDGMVIFFDLDPSLEHGQVQLYAAPGFENAFLSNSERQAIFENDMLPHLRSADFDSALEVAMERIDAAATAEHAEQLQTARQINAAVGLIGAPIAFFGLAGWAFLNWRRFGKDPVYLDDPSILMPAPPPELTAASGAMVMDGKTSRRALTTAMLDLASRGLVAFREEKGILSRKVGVDTDPARGDALLEAQRARNARRPTGPAESVALRELRQLGAGEDDAIITADDLPKFGPHVAEFDTALEGHVVSRGWFGEKPSKVVTRWLGRGFLALFGGILVIVGGVMLPASGLVLIGIATIAGSIVMLVLAPSMPAVTMPGAMIRAMLHAYRRTLHKTMEQARSMQQVVDEAGLDWLDTPDQAVVWGTALGLQGDIEGVLDRSLEDLKQGTASASSLYFPAWYQTSSGESFAAAGVAGSGGSLFSDSAMPDLGGMMSALGTIGNSPSSSGGSGGGGFSGGSSGGGGGGAGGGF